jgi:hypothetical protein
MWEKIKRVSPETPRHKRREEPCVSRSPKRPDAAYLMLPRDMAEAERVSIYADGKGQIAFEFDIAGEYAVRPTSRTSYTMKITIPKALAALIPFGLHEVKLDRNGDGWLILSTGVLAEKLVDL